MIRKIKKGFTLVELVVVIAVIAILAAVSIVTYNSITKKAKESNDHMVIDQVNVVLKASKILDGKPTVHEILENLDMGEGYDIREMKPELDGTQYVYSFKNNEFGYWKESEGKVVYPASLEGRVKDVDLWFFDDAVGSDDEVTFNDGASHYLKSLSGASVINTNGGLDVGKQLVSEINLTGSTTTKAPYNIVVRTNGGTLKINAPKDNVDHFGEGLVLDISAIASESYHEYGYFPKASIAQGRIVVEEQGNIPAVEITAVPTSENPVKVETSKDVVVSASPEVVEELGNASLENVEVKVTSEEASVVVDEKIDSDNVDAKGKSSSEIVSITKVANYSELSLALTSRKPYIMFTADIAYAINGSGLINILYSTTIDGNGYKLSGYGARGSNKTSIAINHGGSQMVDVALSNLTIINNGAGGRPLETRGNIRSLNINNCDFRCTGSSGYMQVITVGGSQSTAAKVTIKHSKIYSPVYYGVITFNPVDLVVEDTEFECWAALYMKSPDGSTGSRGSVVMMDGCKLICHNNNSGTSNDFGALVFEDGSINAVIKNTSIDVTENGNANQYAVLFNDWWASYYGTLLKEVKVTFVNVTIKGNINDEDIEYDSTNVVMIQSGATTNDPTAYLADGSSVETDGLFYYVQ